MVQAISDREFILQRVVQLLTESADASNDSNLVLQLALTELVKQVMRELAQASEADHLQGKLLQSALQTTTQLLAARAETAIPGDLSPSLARLSRSLRWVAKEMTALGLRLQQARQGEVMRAPRIVSAAPVPFQITELGTRGQPEGLLATPLADAVCSGSASGRPTGCETAEAIPGKLKSRGLPSLLRRMVASSRFWRAFPAL